MKLNKKIFVILVSLLFTFLCGCTQNTQFEPTEQPHLYWKDIDVVVENVDSRHWFASTHHYIVYVTVRSDEYQLTYTDEFAGSGAFGYPEQGNYRKGDIVKAEMYSWVMDSTGEIVRQEILMNRGNKMIYRLHSTVLVFFGLCCQQISGNPSEENWSLQLTK